MENDTIAAISTPAGENGIGIVRISGPMAFDIADKIFLPKTRKRPSQFKSHSLHYGHVKSTQGAVIDEALLSVMRAPRTYTTEDMAEVNCHGGVICLKQALELVLRLGARLAEPGEFTKRAFLNGRLDLIQAEAVCDIIASRTNESMRIAQQQLKGDASQKLRAIRRMLIDIAADIEADINFPEEGLNASKLSSIKASLSAVEKDISSLIKFAGNGVILREGITTVICGKPNVGKSSLMNSFLRQDRVIVTPHPGTTRDTIEEVVNLRGIPLKIADTAGIIDAEDNITKESVDRSRRYMESADLILLVLDSSGLLTEQDIKIIDIVKDKRVLVVVNKSDLPEVLQSGRIREYLRDKVIIKVSAKEKTGLAELEEAIYNMFFSGKLAIESMILSNRRQIDAAEKALSFIKSAIEGIKQKRHSELLIIDIRDAVRAIGVITGDSFTEEVLNSVFSRFCVGK